MNKDEKSYEHALTLWLKARKETPATIDIGPEPNPESYGFIEPMEKWQAGKIRDRIVREMSRTIE